MKYKVEALPTYKELDVKDEELKKMPEAGYQWNVSEERLEVLLGNNKYKEAFVKVIGETKPAEEKTNKKK